VVIATVATVVAAVAVPTVVASGQDEAAGRFL